MAFTYDPSTDSGKVRLLCGDQSEDGRIFEDAEIDAFLAIEDGSIRFAAATALEAIAASEVLIQKKIKLLDIETDGPACAKALMELAGKLRDAEEQTGSFDVAEQVYPPFGLQDRLWRQLQRGVF